MNARYLVIDNNTMSRESFSVLIYGLENNSVVHECESLNKAEGLGGHYGDINYVIFNSSYEVGHERTWPNKLNKLTPDSKVLLIVKSSEFINVDGLADNGVCAVVTINSSKNEFIAAIRSLKIGQQFVGQHVLRTTDYEDDSNSSEKLPTLKNKFANEIKNKLTNRQCEVLDYMTKGYANKLIAYELGVSEGTIKLHVSSILRALKVTNRTEAAMKAGQFLTSHAH